MFNWCDTGRILEQEFEEKKQRNRNKMTIQTSCEDCVFTLRENGVQTGCELNLLDNFTKTFSAEKKAYLLDGLCKFCRDSKWGERYGKNMDQIEEENSIKVEYIVFLYGHLSNVLTTVKEINESEVMPSSVAFVNLTKNSSSEVMKILNENVKVPKTLTRPIDANKDLLIETLAKRCKFQYFAIFDSTERIPANYVALLNKLIDEGRKISMITPKGCPEGWHGTIMQTLLFNKVGGNNGMDARDKVIALAEEQGKEEMVMEL